MAELLFELIRKTAAPFDAEPYGPFHLCFLIFGVPCAVAAALLIPMPREPKKRDVAEARLFFAIGAALLAGETYKQLFYPAVEGVWRADLFPFQLCSVPMYVCLAMPFLRGGARGAAYRFLATYGLMGGVASYIAPGTMLRPYLSLAVHSFLWHLVLIFLGVRAAVGGEAEIGEHSPRGFLSTAALYLTLCAAAFAVNVSFHASHPEVNMFYLGPSPSPLPVCRDITALFGVPVNSVLYMLALTLCAYLIYLAWGAILRKGGKKKES